MEEDQSLSPDAEQLEPEIKKSDDLISNEILDSPADDNVSKTVKSKKEIISEIMKLVSEGENLKKKNKVLQQKLALFIRGSAEKDYFQKIDFPSDANGETFKLVLEDILKRMKDVEILQKNNAIQVESFQKEISEKDEMWLELNKTFIEMKERIAFHAMHSETGECFTKEEIKDFLEKEREVYATLQEFQLESIRKRHSLNAAIEKKRNLAEGPLDFTEYEMMSIETENNIEAIQEIKQEIKDSMKKSSHLVNKLSHLGQKRYSRQSEKITAEEEGKALEDELNKRKHQLFIEKKIYSRKKEENEDLQHKSILLQYPRLIEDYNIIQQENEEAQKELEQLKREYENSMKVLSYS